MVCKYKKLDRLEDSNSAVRNYKWIKAVAFDLANCILEKESDHLGSSFFKDTNKMYTEELKIYVINKKVNLSCFTVRLIASMSLFNYTSI